MFDNNKRVICHCYNVSFYYGFYFISGATAADALSIGYRTILIDDCCRGVDLNDIEKTKNNVIKNHGVIVQSNEVNKNQIYLLFFLVTEYFIF